MMAGYAVTASPTAYGFWDIARRTTDGIRPFRTEAGITSFFQTVRACVPETGDQELARGFMGSIPFDAIITNLGDLAIPVEVGRLHLEAVWGPFGGIGKRDEIMIGVAGLDGALRLVQTNPRSVPFVLAEIGEALEAACSREG